MYRLQEMQRQARATIELMKETYTRIKNDEEKKKGLVVIKALYGKLPSGEIFIIILIYISKSILLYKYYKTEV